MDNEMNMTMSLFNMQVKRMVAFIEYEALEKQEEIDLKSEGEFHSEKGRLIKEGTQVMNRAYNKRKTQLDKKRIVEISTFRNEARIRCLAVTELHVSNIAAEVQARMVNRLGDKPFYEELLFKLVMQGLYMMVEKEVMLKVRQEDSATVKSMLHKAADAYKHLTKTDVKLTVLEEYLPGSSLGGVELCTPNGKYFVRNTFQSRLELIIQQSIPLIREGLFEFIPRTSVMDQVYKKRRNNVI